MKLNILILFAITIFFFSCKKDDTKNKAIARCYDKYLYQSDIKDLVSKNTSKKDSISVVNNFIKEWVKMSILTQKASENIEEDDEIIKQVEDYKNSLLIHKYLQHLTDKNALKITDEEIEKYYKQNEKEFVLSSNIVQAIYIEAPKNSELSNKESLITSANNQDALNDLQDFCYKNSFTFFLQNKWTYLSGFLQKLKVDFGSPTDILQSKFRKIEKDNMLYYIKIVKYQEEGTLAPIEFVKNDIKTMIINRNKIKYIRDIEDNFYQDALDNKEVEILK